MNGLYKPVPIKLSRRTSAEEREHYYVEKILKLESDLRVALSELKTARAELEAAQAELATLRRQIDGAETLYIGIDSQLYKLILVEKGADGETKI